MYTTTTNTSYVPGNLSASNNTNNTNINMTNSLSLAESLLSFTPGRGGGDREGDTSTTATRGLQQKYMAGFAAYIRKGQERIGSLSGEESDSKGGQSRGQRQCQGVIQNNLNFGPNVDAIRTVGSNRDRMKQLEEELAQRKGNLRRNQEDMETFKKERVSEREGMVKTGKKTEKQYEKVKKEIVSMGTNCGQMQDGWKAGQGTVAFFEPFVTRVGVDMKKMACGEGKPVHVRGEGGTCAVFNCPLKEDPEKP